MFGSNFNDWRAVYRNPAGGTGAEGDQGAAGGGETGQHDQRAA